MDANAARKTGAAPASAFHRSGQDVLLLGTCFAAIILFVGTGSKVLAQLLGAANGVGVSQNGLMTGALLLNIALIIFGWRRHRDLVAEVRERSNAEHQARLLAETDPLTGCLNRRSIAEATESLYADCTNRGECVAMVMIDIDNFKRLNDCNGHAVGDTVLRESTRRIGALLPEGALLARLGGDEFACAVPFAAHASARVEELAERIIVAIAAPIEVSGTSLEGVSVSIGLARSDSLKGPDGSASGLLHMADIAMYHAKKSGKNSYFWFESAMESELRFRSELEAGIRAGIGRGEFVPFYEPQVDLDSGRIVGFEMLARWRSPKLGLVGPDVFIPIAEEIGVIAELSESVIRQALVDATEWDPALILSVNISPVQLRDPWFSQKLLKLLVEANFPPARLEVEVTETCLHENLSLVRTLVTSLKNQGIGISLDDFGTGYSSLSQLRSLPFDRIKIDRSFVATLPGNRDSATIIQAISALGEGLGLPITAEGVENEEVLAELRGLGTFKAQGYLYGRPESGTDLRDRLAGLGLLQLAAAVAPPVILPRTDAA